MKISQDIRQVFDVFTIFTFVNTTLLLLIMLKRSGFPR